MQREDKAESHCQVREELVIDFIQLILNFHNLFINRYSRSLGKYSAGAFYCTNRYGAKKAQ